MAPPPRGPRGGSNSRGNRGANNHASSNRGNDAGRGRGRGGPSGSNPSGMLQAHRSKNNGSHSKSRNSSPNQQNSRNSSPNRGRSSSPNNAQVKPHSKDHQKGKGDQKGSDKGRDKKKHADDKTDKWNDKERYRKEKAPNLDPRLEQHVKARYEFLQQERGREKAQAIADGTFHDASKRTTLEHAITPVGTCEDMCPEFERVQRVMRHEVDRCEKTQREEGWVPAGERMVKKWTRPDAGSEEQLPSDLRTPEALVNTMEYLIEDVIGKEERLIACHNFVWDRTRAIRQDFDIQRVSNEVDVEKAVDCHEKIARFLILSLHVLTKDDELRSGERFDAQQDVEQLNKTFTSLWNYYDASLMTTNFTNEAEFRSYQILFEIQAATPDLEDRMQSWPEHVLTDPSVQVAFKLYELATSILRYRGPLSPLTPQLVTQMNSLAFWEILASPAVSYLMACVAEMSFYYVRFGFLKVLWKSVKQAAKAQQKQMKEWTVCQMRDYLGFDWDEEVEAYCADLDLGFYGRNDKGEKYLDFARDTIFAFEIENAPSKQIYSQCFVEEKRFHRSYVSVIHGGTVREAIEAHDVFDQEVEMKGDEQLAQIVPEGESSMFFPETTQSHSGSILGGAQSQEQTPAFGSRMFGTGLNASAKPFQTGLGGMLTGQQSFEDAVATAGQTPGMFSSSMFARPAPQQSGPAPYNPFSTANISVVSSKPTVDPSAPYDPNHAFGSAQYSPTKNIFGPKPAVRESINPFANGGSLSGAPSTFANPFLPQESSRESRLGGDPASFSNQFALSSQTTSASNTSFSQPALFASQSQSVFAKSSQPAGLSSGFQSQSPFPQNSQLSSGFNLNQPAQPSTSSWTPPQPAPQKQFSWPATAKLETTESAGSGKKQDLIAATKTSANQQQDKFQQPQRPAAATPPPQYSEFSSQQISPYSEPPKATPPIFNFSATRSQSTSPQSPKKPAFQTETKQAAPSLVAEPTQVRHSASLPAIKPTQGAPALTSFEFKTTPAASPPAVSNSSFKRAAPQPSSTPSSSTPKSTALTKGEYIETTARLGLSQPKGLLHEYLEYTLEKILPPILDQHYTEVFTQKVVRLRTNTLGRKFGKLWKRFAYESSLNRRAVQRRAKFAESLRMENDKKRKREDDLGEIMAAMQDSKRIMEEQKRERKEAEKAKKEEETKLAKLRQEQPQRAGKKRNSVGEPSAELQPPVRVRHEPFGHKRSRTVGSSMLPPPRPAQEPAETSFRASIFSSGNSSLGQLGRSSSFRDSQRSRSDTQQPQDHTTTDFFRLLAHDLDPETPLIPLTKNQMEARAKREEDEREAKLNAIYNRRRVGQRATPPRASPSPQAAVAIDTPSTRESTPRSPYNPNDDDLIRQVREATQMLAEGSDWFKEQSATLEKQVQYGRRRSSTSSQGSPRVSVNGIDYLPASGPSMSRTERLIRGYGLDKPKPKHKPLGGSDYVPVPMSKRTAARYQIEFGEVDGDADEEIQTSGTAKKKRKHGVIDYSYRPDPRFDEEDVEEEYDEVPEKRVKDVRHAAPVPAPRVKLSNPFDYLPQGDEELYDDEEEEELLEDNADPNHYYHNGADGDTDELVDDEDDLLEEEDDEEDDLLEDEQDEYEQDFLRTGSQPYDDAGTPATQVSHVSSGPGASKDDAIALSDSD